MENKDAIVESEEFDYKFEISENRDKCIAFYVSTHGIGKDEVTRLTSYIEKIKSDIKNILA